MPQGDALRIVLPAVVILGHVLLPCLFALWLAFSRAKSRLYLVGVAALATLATVGTAMAGTNWDWLGVYTRYLLPLFLLLALFRARKKFRELPWKPAGERKSRWFGIVVLGAVVAVFLLNFGNDVANKVTARSYEGTPVHFAFPLRGRVFAVGNGGANAGINHHYDVPAQRYALDISALNRWGSRASGLYPAENDAYEVFGAEVVSPCAGNVVQTRDGLADLRPGDMDAENLFGNYAILHCDGVSVLLAHLKKGSVLVEGGERVAKGAAIGAVGNTGNTSEPHLHIHAIDGYSTDFKHVAFRGKSRPMLFDQKFFKRGDTIEAI